MFTKEEVMSMMGGNSYSRTVESTTGTSLWGHWGIALLILIVIALFYGVTSRNKREFEREMKADERRLADNLYNLNGRLGIVEKGVSDNSVQILKNENVLTGLTQDYSFRIGTIGAQTANNTSAINQLGSYTCNVPSAGCGCGVRSGLPEFVKRAKYVQDGTPEVIEREACGNAFA